MHVFGTVGHDEAVDDVRVMDRLGQVVDMFLSVVLASQQPRAWLGAVAPEAPDQIVEKPLLPRRCEIDLLRECLKI